MLRFLSKNIQNNIKLNNKLILNYSSYYNKHLYLFNYNNFNYLNNIINNKLNYNNQNNYINNYNKKNILLYSTINDNKEEKINDEPVIIDVPKEGEVIGVSEQHSFQAETRQLLDIVTHSLYTDKEVFLRELISNASDALEKLRHIQLEESKENDISIKDKDLPLEISIKINEKDGTLIIEDSGIGLTSDEMKNTLGTIANSGSKQFIETLKKSQNSSNQDIASDIIGQFGVGFYSSFMVADKVKVYSQSYNSNEKPYLWESDGSGSYSLTKVSDMKRGCKIVIKLKESEKSYLNVDNIKDIIKRYSNFVTFPIKVNGETINTIQAIWVKDKNSIKDEEYNEFYKFISSDYMDPLYKFHFSVDAPLNIKAIFYIPTSHTEKFGMGRMKPNINLYSRKVLIEEKSKEILPEWLRFISGVVDSEDLPLSISREKPQDSALINRISTVLTRRLIRFFEELAKKEPELYKTKFFPEFGMFLKEGACQDFNNQSKIAKLLYFESSKKDANNIINLDEYISDSLPEQKDIYFLSAPNRELAESSPYFEAFKNKNIDVLFIYNAIDEFVMNNLRNYNNRRIVSIESKDIDIDKIDIDNKKDNDNKNKDENKDDDDNELKLNENEITDLSNWMKTILGDKVSEVKTTNRLKDFPAIIVDHESASVRRMMRMIDQSKKNDNGINIVGKQNLEINPKHPIIRNLYKAKNNNADIAELITQQIFDNCLIQAGLIDDGRSMIPRLNKLMENILEDKK